MILGGHHNHQLRFSTLPLLYTSCFLDLPPHFQIPCLYIKVAKGSNTLIQLKQTNRSILILGAKLTAVVIHTDSMGKLSLRLSALECSYESSLQASSDREYSLTSLFDHDLGLYFSPPFITFSFPTALASLPHMAQWRHSPCWHRAQLTCGYWQGACA